MFIFPILSYLYLLNVYCIFAFCIFMCMSLYVFCVYKRCIWRYWPSLWGPEELSEPLQLLQGWRRLRPGRAEGWEGSGSFWKFLRIAAPLLVHSWFIPEAQGSKRAGWAGGKRDCRAMVTCLTCQTDLMTPCTYFLLPAVFTVFVYKLVCFGRFFDLPLSNVRI